MLAAAFAFFLVAFPFSSHADEDWDWLVLVIDVSGSINEAEYRLQKEAYVRILSDPLTISALDRTKIAIIEFASEAHLVVEWTNLAAAAAIYEVSGRNSQGSTGVASGIRMAIELLAGRSGRRIIDVSGDGVDNVTRDTAATVDAARDRGIIVNALVIGGEERVVDFYIEEVAAPGGGFIATVDDFRDFRDALRMKLFFEVAVRVDG